MTQTRRLVPGWLFAAMLSAALLAAVSPVWAAEGEFDDPWEGFNRKVHAFNMTTDRFFLRPIAVGYRYVTPDFMQTGVRNVFNNVKEVPSALNGLLQGKPGSAAHDTGRFLINSTLGIAGLFDVARHMGLENSDHEDFGQTLAVWGFDRGPYLVLPFLGASNVRDAFALPVDGVTDPLFYIDHTRTRNTVLVMSVINRRSQLLDLEEHLTGDHYTFIRDAYLQRREFLVNDGEVEDDFGADMDMSEYGDFDDGSESDPF
ncbi:MlaA family lipoprotein [Marinimicrobium sp. ARAG 43.8]|uniref:MlaA family lipoprotein n=1 Tax=Marinimicrobium sp. ARAG 43.8 TaxID=3418719 RepID=UPI003CF86D7A